MNANTQIQKMSVRQLRRMRERDERIVAVTAYDATTAQLVDESGVHLILVGDSMGMTMLGYKNTIPVTMEQCLHHTAAVARKTRRALVVADMPFLSYQITPEEALRNAGAFLQQAGADAVKLEGGTAVAHIVRRLVSAGIPVLSHIGIMPQSILAEGGYRIRGRTAQEAEQLTADALAVEEAGAFGVVLEGLPMELTRQLTEKLKIPTIGIGAGPFCSGQIQVIHDILGLLEDFVPKHAKRYANLAQATRQAVSEYVREVREGAFPNEEHSFS